MVAAATAMVSRAVVRATRATVKILKKTSVMKKGKGVKGGKRRSTNKASTRDKNRKKKNPETAKKKLKPDWDAYERPKLAKTLVFSIISAFCAFMLALFFLLWFTSRWAFRA